MLASMELHPGDEKTNLKKIRHLRTDIQYDFDTYDKLKDIISQVNERRKAIVPERTLTAYRAARLLGAIDPGEAGNDIDSV